MRNECPDIDATGGREGAARELATNEEGRAIDFTIWLCSGQCSTHGLDPIREPIYPDTIDPESYLAVLESPLHRQSGAGIARAWPIRAWRGLYPRHWRYAGTDLRGPTIGAVGIPPG